MAALMLSITSAFASTKMLYQQNFETVTNPADAGWSFGGAELSIQSDDFGKFLRLYQGQVNGRSGQGIWGTEIYGEGGSALEDGKYTVKFDFCPKNNAANQYNSGLTLMTNCRTAANQPFNGRWTNPPAEGQTVEGYLLDLTQVETATDATAFVFYVNSDKTNEITLNSDTWYTIEVQVDVNTRETSYMIMDIAGALVTSGTRVVPATEFDGTDISMYAEGIWAMVARYQKEFLFDNIEITCESAQDVANDPTIALTGIGIDENGELNLNCRKYTITFMDGEILTVTLPDGTTQEVSYGDCDGNYEVYTTVSGTLSAYTSAGSATSNTITTEVDATPCVLPAATATIQSVKEGYAKQYKLTVDNSQVPLSPVLLISYKFTGEDGTSLEAEDQSNGTVLDLPGKGTLELTTACFGYQATTITVENDKEFKLKAKYDIANMEPSYFTEKGFEAQEDLNSSATSGEGNWTARKGMFYYDEATGVDDGEGNMTYTAVYPYGYVADDNTENVIHRYRLLSSKLHEQESTLIPGLTFAWGSEKTITPEEGDPYQEWSGFNMQWKQGIGIIVNTMKKGDAEDGDGMSKAGNVPVQVDNLDATDFVVVRKVSNYGRDMAHPVLANGPVPANGYDLFELANIREVWTPTDGIVTFDLYRIDTALAGIEVFADASATGIKNINNSQKVQNNYIYNLAGQKVGANFKGIIIKNGSKFIVK